MPKILVGVANIHSNSSKICQKCYDGYPYEIFFLNCNYAPTGYLLPLPLSRNPTAYGRVKKEVRAVFNNPAEVAQGPQLNSCIYLRACIFEAIRLCPAVSGTLWREVLDGGLSIPEMNMHIPACCEVGTGIWSLNHNEKYFLDPFAFQPERWVAEESGDEAVNLAKTALASFSVGPRNCVGKGLAITEISLAMAAVISQYEFRRAETRCSEVGEGKGVFKGQFQTFLGVYEFEGWAVHSVSEIRAWLRLTI
jgi:cytochrome P450